MRGLNSFTAKHLPQKVYIWLREYTKSRLYMKLPESRRVHRKLTFTTFMFVPRAESPISPSAEDLRLRDTIFDVISYLSAISCIIIILTAILLSLHPLSRQKTDRVSFRIMIYALCGSVVYTIATMIKYRVRGQTICRFSGTFVVFGLHISSFMFFCIGLNLQLVMIHGIDGARAEKYYVWGSLLLAIVLSVLTYVSKQLVYNPTQLVCYYYDSDHVRGLWWRVCIQYLWGFLTMAGELVTFLSVVFYLIRVKVFESGPSRETTTTSRSQGLSASHQYRKPLGPRQYRNVVLRIALYPLSSLATLGIMSIGAIASPSQGAKTRSDWNTVNSLRVLYMSRGIVYASVAAADPAITQGLKMLYRHYVLRRQTSDLPSVPNDVDVSRSVVHAGVFELEEIYDSKNESLRRACLHQSRSSVTLPPIPEPAAVPPNGDVQLGTRSTCTFIDVGSESQIDDSIHYSYRQLRQL